jgi:hypothetical protein
MMSMMRYDEVRPHHTISKVYTILLLTRTQISGTEIVDGFDLDGGEGVVVDADVIDFAVEIIWRIWTNTYFCSLYTIINCYRKFLPTDRNCVNPEYLLTPRVNAHIG